MLAFLQAIDNRSQQAAITRWEGIAQSMVTVQESFESLMVLSSRASVELRKHVEDSIDRRVSQIPVLPRSRDYQTS